MWTFLTNPFAFAIQTYTLNREHYRDQGPIFVFVSNAEFHEELLTRGLVFDIAAATGGALATFDHRFTGDNLLTEGSSLEELALLTVDQALADIAFFITTLRRDLDNTQGRVIVWGTGYGASLATFARKKFPHLVDGVFASSPLFRAEAVDSSM